MDLRSICISNGLGIFLLIMLNYVSRTRQERRRIDDRIFSMMVILVMGACFLEAFSYLIDGRVFIGARIINYIANTYLFTINLIVPFGVLVYIDYGLYGDMSRIPRSYKPQIVVGIIMLSLNLINFFTPIVFYINEQNIYERRPLSYLYYAVILWYCLSSAYVTKRYERSYGAKAFFNIYMFLLPVLLGAGLQFAFYGLSVAWLAAAVGLNCLYMMQQNETAYIDSLLEIYNRRYLDHILSSWTRDGIRFTGMMIDVDNFKSINDRFGHSEGDRALTDIAGVLRTNCRRNEFLFRFAGDEFIVLERTDSQEGLGSFIEGMTESFIEFNKNSGRPYILSVSYGVGTFEPGIDNIDSFMKKLDGHMYEMKEVHHVADAAYTDGIYPDDAYDEDAARTGA